MATSGTKRRGVSTQPLHSVDTGTLTSMSTSTSATTRRALQRNLCTTSARDCNVVTGGIYHVDVDTATISFALVLSLFLSF